MGIAGAAARCLVGEVSRLNDSPLSQSCCQSTPAVVVMGFDADLQTGHAPGLSKNGFATVPFLYVLARLIHPRLAGVGKHLLHASLHAIAASK